MILFGKNKKGDTENEPAPAAAALTEAFTRKIEEHEDLIYGIALFFEGISLLYAGQEAVIETYKKQFRNIIRSGSDALQHAQALLEESKNDPSKVDAFAQFDFLPCTGHTDPEGMTKRAKILVETYNVIFPGRDRSKPFQEPEILQLIETASLKLDL